MKEKVTIVIKGYPLFCGATEIRIIDFEGKEVCSYNGRLPGGSGKQWSEFHITAGNLGYPSKYVAETYFRGKLVGFVRFRTYVR